MIARGQLLYYTESFEDVVCNLPPADAGDVFDSQVGRKGGHYQSRKPFEDDKCRDVNRYNEAGGS